MSPTEVLKSEHEAITLTLRVLEEVCGRLEADVAVEREDPPEIAGFLTIFADKCHHGKEEDLLFPAMEAAGVAREGGLIAVLLAEHAQGRAYIRDMGEALDRCASGDASARNAFVQNARGYIELLTQHIAKEDETLFPLAEQCVSGENQKELVKGFATIERDRIGVGVHGGLLALSHRLAERYLPT